MGPSAEAIIPLIVSGVSRISSRAHLGERLPRRPARQLDADAVLHLLPPAAMTNHPRRMPYEEVRRGARHAHPDVEVNLIPWRDAIRGARVEDWPRAAMHRIVSRVLDKYVPGLRELTLDVERRLPRGVPTTRLGQPEEGQHTSNGPRSIQLQ